MKIKSLIIFLTIAILFAACKKGVEPIDGNNATVELKGSTLKKYITGDISVNPNDSIFFDFTITTNQDMGFVSLQKNPVNQSAFLKRDTIKTVAAKRTYSALFALKADSANGPFVYRIVAHTSTGTYIGHKDVIITTNSDYYYYTNRFLYAPDTTGKSNKCYISVRDGGKTYSYSEGAAVSSSIDFAYFYDTSKTGTVVNGHTIYALTATNGFTPYDISTWTKNATILKKATAAPNPTFPNIFNAGAIRTLCNTQLASGTSNKVVALSATSPANIVYFRTSAGKNGIMILNFSNGSTADKTTYINVDVKIER